MLALGNGQQGVKAAAGVMKNADSVHVNAHGRDGVSGGSRRNKMDRRSDAGAGWRLNGNTGKRCPDEQQRESAQGNNLF